MNMTITIKDNEKQQQISKLQVKHKINRNIGNLFSSQHEKYAFFLVTSFHL